LTQITCMGVLAHPLRPESYPLAERIEQSLRRRGLATWLHTTWTEEDIRRDAPNAQMVVAIGGDGAMLRAARVCAPLGVPVLGVNIGYLGFLTEIAKPGEWETHLEQVLAGRYWIERRAMIQTTVRRNGEVMAGGTALNEVMVSSNKFARIINLEVFIDQAWATAYNVDALVVATATGSTAYALSCGGPILPPQLTNILIVPAAPHLSMDRSMVLAQGAQVEIVPSSINRNVVVVTADGVELGELPPGGRVQVCATDYAALFVRLRAPNYFYRSLFDLLEPRIQRSQAEKPVDNGT